MLGPVAALLVVGTIASGAVAPDAAAQDYPDKPIRIIVPFTPGGSSDILARTFAQRAALGQPILVENVPGATGAIGLTRVAKSAPDGYTLAMGASATFVISPHFNFKLSYDPIRDFVPIAILAVTPNALVVNANLPANSVGELVALAKANPGKLNFASIGTGTGHQLMGEMLRRSAGIDIVNVPYKGSPQALTALLAGEVQLFFFPAFVDALSHLQSGRLRALGVADSRRSQAAPEIPTLPELGHQIVSPAWHALVAPAGTRNAIVQRLAAEVQRVNSLEEVKQILAKQGSETRSMAPEALLEYIVSEHARYGRLIRDIGVKAE